VIAACVDRADAAVGNVPLPCIVKTKLLGLLLLAAGAAFGQLSIGIRIGAPPPVRVVRVQPRSPGEGYTWIAGYWYPVNNRYTWHEGYWTRPAYAGAHWVAPHHDGERDFAGYWDGDHGQVAHDHKWDKSPDHNRDYNHDK
jgi:WXXGXW repeat (2 copies)